MRQHAAMTGGLIEYDPLDHTMVTAALARLGGNGAWDRLLGGELPTEPLDRADVDLLVAVGVLGGDGDRLRLTRDEPWMLDGTRMSHGLVARLRRALQHAEGGGAGWSAADAEMVLRQGRASAVAADQIVDRILCSLPGALEAWERGTARFLDVGVGVAAISITLCRRFPGVGAVGLDVLPEVLELARSEVRDAGLGERIELRLESVADLTDSAAYDLAWVPQPFIPRPVFETGLRRVLTALRPGAWLVAPLITSPDGLSELDTALAVHEGHLLGGGPLDAAEARALATRLGFDSVTTPPFLSGSALVARRPA